MVGQRAEIKFTAFNTNYLPVLYGHVATIGADAMMDEATKTPYYKVKIAPEPEAVTLLEEQGWQLVSGMPADTYIQTRERTLINYIFKPLTLMFSRAFNEDEGVK
jgi:HlyD family secretion protein